MSYPFQGIKALFFDYGGTLDAPGVAWKEHFYPIYKRHGVNVNKDDFTRAFYLADDSLVAEDPEHLNLTEIVLEQVRRVLNNLGCYREDLHKRIASEFVRNSLENIQKNKNHLNHLKKRYRLGIISNNYGNLQAICQETGLDEVMEVLVDSNRVGSEKPDKQIFQHALKILGVEPQESVMIGDNVKRDILGAQSVGMATILISSGNLPPDVSPPPDVPVISDISELIPILTNERQQ